jgi:hypothetical protein
MDWYNFTATPHRSIKFITLAFEYNAPLSMDLLRWYATILARRKQLSGAGLRVFGRYLLGRYVGVVDQK